MIGKWLRRRATVAAPIVIQPSGRFEGNDGPWSTFPIHIGTPPQAVNVLPSTKSYQTWAILPEGCTRSDPANCPTARGGAFQPSDSSTWRQNADSSGGLYPLVLETNLNVTGNGSYGYDTVTLGGQDSGPSLTGQVVAGIATKAYYLGLFGLNGYSTPLPQTTAPLPNFMSMLNDTGRIPSLSWSYTAGNQYRLGSPGGSLVLGGYDTDKYIPNDVTFPFNKTNGGDFNVNIGGLFLNTINDDGTTLSTPNESVPAIVDSTSPYLILPYNICEQFELTFGLTWDDDVQAYLVNDSLNDALQNRGVSVVFNLGNSSTIPGEGFNVTLPYAAFNLTAGPPLLNNASRYFPLMRSADDKYVLGRTFLQEAYMTVDYERESFNLSQCSWENNAASHIVPIERPNSNTQASSGLSKGAIAGIVIGALAGLLVLILLGIFLYRRRQRKSQKYMQQKPTHIDMPPNNIAEIDSPYTDPHHTSLFGKLSPPGYPKSPELDSSIHKGHELQGEDVATPLATPLASPLVPMQEHPYELDATERRRSRMLSSISSMSGRSGGASPRMPHPRQLSDHSDISENTTTPKEPVSALSAGAGGGSKSFKRRTSDQQTPISPDVPVVEEPGTMQATETPVQGKEGGEMRTPIAEQMMAGKARGEGEGEEGKKGHTRELSDPVSVLSDRPGGGLEVGDEDEKKNRRVSAL